MTALRAGALLLAALLLGGCGSGSGGSSNAADPDAGEAGLGKAADTQTCVADARKYAGPLPADYPRDFPLPRGAVLFNVEDRGADGVIGTAVVAADLRTVLAELNGPAQDQGFKVTGGETEDHDAEANWEGNGFRGRWAIRDSASCDGEVVVQLLAEKQ